MNTHVPTGRRKALGGAGALLLAVGLAACSSPGDGGSGGGSGGGGGDGGEGLPDTIKIMNIRALTGPVSFAGLAAQQGIDLALAEIEEDGLLGDSTIELDTRDSAASAQEAASFAGQAAADPSFSAIIGPEASAQATAVSPIADQAGIPVVYVQAGSEGVLTGDFTFRMTPPAESYFDIVGDYLEQQGVTTAAVVINTGNPTLVQLGEDTIPAMGEDHGFEVISSSGVETTAQDFTNQASSIAGDAPDAAFLMVQGPQAPVAITQLRQAGFEGEIIGMSAMGAGNLSSAGQTAEGAVWPANFNAGQPDESSQTFVEAFRAEYDEDPTNYSAEAYDAMWFLARAIAEADSADRGAVQQAMTDLAGEGFEGAQGSVTFEGNDARVDGVLVRWDGAAEVPFELGEN
ncbi:ABC transporter substrate-binding protein [Trujillonella endophytica]|uniref:Branched-chain amino acid transport system substrate-binding protein n=1 Tax=Trujillonella endophytica TaxID=673521 RepID=A0A1H8QJ70_9ACTN|nr:ABC transporter substrate-binding protein [Trujillella endophytica]SEO54295.1 branched-chain amino acid transport system substrate-binding protein [Trujillella endophytica]